MAGTINDEVQENISLPKCGIIMPISSSLGYVDSHWNDVLAIITEAITDAKFEPNLVSSDDAIGLIHERIVNNIYSNEMIVCDVSSKNPNVMFELGMRLAFDKPVIIIKDHSTDYSFDTSGIEHLSYSTSLRFSDIVQFKRNLAEKIINTHNRSKSDASYSPFLKSFSRSIKMLPSTFIKEEIPMSEYLIKEIDGLRRDFHRFLTKNAFVNPTSQYGVSNAKLDFLVADVILTHRREYGTVDRKILLNDIMKELENTGKRYRASTVMNEIDNQLGRLPLLD